MKGKTKQKLAQALGGSGPGLEMAIFRSHKKNNLSILWVLFFI